MGFEGALQDTPLPASLAPHAAAGTGLGSGGVIDLLSEASDPLSLHEITVQFAGVKVCKCAWVILLFQRPFVGQFGTLVPVGRGRTGSAAASFYDSHCPKRVYFSYQFYTCMPTRTEILRLVGASNLDKDRDGGLHSDASSSFSALARDEAYARDEAPLMLRYMIDCSAPLPSPVPGRSGADDGDDGDQSSLGAGFGAVQNSEAIEFVEYLARAILFVDVWVIYLLPFRNVPVLNVCVCVCIGCGLSDAARHLRSSAEATLTARPAAHEDGVGVRYHRLR